MEFTNIDNFEKRMCDDGVSVAFFSVRYHNCVIEVAYSMNQKKFLFAFVDHNLGFTCSLNGAHANGYINHPEAVAQLMKCRNHNKFDPIHFYDFLNGELPTANIHHITANEYIRTIARAVSNFEDRIFFNHWRRANISAQQSQKASELMGNEVVDFCRENTLTPVFYIYPTERTLASFEDFRLDYNNYGLQQ